jgi:hypothetical protein
MFGAGVRSAEVKRAELAATLAMVAAAEGS